MTDYIEAENETDRMSDAQRPMAEAERDRIIKQISREIEDNAPRNWYKWHSRRCNVEFRGCAPECPKRAYEETGTWLSPELIDEYWKYNAERVQPAQPGATTQAA